VKRRRRGGHRSGGGAGRRQRGGPGLGQVAKAEAPPPPRVAAVRPRVRSQVHELVAEGRGGPGVGDVRHGGTDDGGGVERRRSRGLGRERGAGGKGCRVGRRKLKVLLLLLLRRRSREEGTHCC